MTKKKQSRAELVITAAEVEALRLALSALVVESRTGQLGVIHGMERFVWGGCILKKAERELLNSLAGKVGLPGLKSV